MVDVRRRNVHKGAGDGLYTVDFLAAPLLGLWIYLLRGSLLPSVVYSSAIVFASLCVCFLVTKKCARMPHN